MVFQEEELSSNKSHLGVECVVFTSPGSRDGKRSVLKDLLHLLAKLLNL